MKKPLAIWRDRGGRFSFLRVAVLLCLLAPLIKAGYDFDAIWLAARPIHNLLLRAGFWALIFLLVTLAVTPFSHIARFPQLLDVRRMLGVGAFAYAAAHVFLYLLDLKFNWVEITSEIVKRNRLLIGFVALIGLTLLAATSTDGMTRRLGGRHWRRLHRVVYLIAILAVLHYFLRFKLIEWPPTLAAGLLGWLLGYRLLIRWRGAPSAWTLLALAIVIAAMTFLGEAVALGVQANISPLRVAEAWLDFETIRPGWLVLGAGLGAAALEFARAHRSGPRRSAHAKSTFARRGSYPSSA